MAQNKGTLRHSPAFFWIAALALGAALVMTANTGPTVPSLPSFQRDNQSAVQPVVQPVQQASVVEVAPVTKERLKVEVGWRETSKDSIPWDKLIFVSAAKASSELSYPSENARGFGDGTAFMVANLPYEKEDIEVSFTPDKGKTWFTVANPYPGRSITPTDPAGALFEGDTLVLFIALQSQPWVFTYWRADDPLATIEGLSP